MKFQSDSLEGKEIVLLGRNGEKEEFSVTYGDDGEICLELFGGSTEGEYYTLSLEEATNLMNALINGVRRQERHLGR